MLSGGACRSLWEPLCVWMTPTVRVSRVPIIQLNPDRADMAQTRMSKRVCKRAAGRTRSRTHGQAKKKKKKITSEHTNTRTGGGGGRLVEGSDPSSVVPVAGDLGQTAASSARQAGE